MNMDLAQNDNLVLAPPSVLRPRCSGSSETIGRLSGLPNLADVHLTSWLLPMRIIFFVSLVALAALPAPVSAVPLTPRHGVDVGIHGLHRRDSTSSSDGSITMNVWLPILIVSVVFILFSLCTCIRRHATSRAATPANRATTSTAPNGNAANTTAARTRRRPQRTPSQISTKSLPPYMKEPGDQELVLYRGPEETEDDLAPPHVMPMLTEDDEEHADMRNETFDIPLNRIESVDTAASSTTNLIRRASESVPRPPELHHASMPHEHRRNGDSLDSVGSDAELLAHQRTVSVDSPPDPRGEAPSYTEAVEGGIATISLNDPDPNNLSSYPVIPPLSHVADPEVGRGRSRFSFLMHPFSSRNTVSENVDPVLHSARSESPALHTRSGSTLSRFSSRDSHETHHSRAPSRNNISRGHTRSSSNLFRAFRSHSPGPQTGSTISLVSISAPLTHTATRAEFHAPKGGLMTPEQIKLITSREALEKFGVPYGPDAVAAFSMSQERLAGMGPPPEFESVAGEHQEGASGSGSGNGASEAVADITAGALATGFGPVVTHPASLSPVEQSVRAESRTSTLSSYSTAHESGGEGDSPQAQSVQAYTSDDENDISGTGGPRTARPTTSGTAWSGRRPV